MEDVLRFLVPVEAALPLLEGALDFDGTFPVDEDTALGVFETGLEAEFDFTAVDQITVILSSAIWLDGVRDGVRSEEDTPFLTLEGAEIEVRADRPPSPLVPAVGTVVFSEDDDVFSVADWRAATVPLEIDLAGGTLYQGAGGLDSIVFSETSLAVGVRVVDRATLALTYEGATFEVRDIERIVFQNATIAVAEDGTMAGAGFGTGLERTEAQTVAYLYEAGLDRDGNIDLPGLNFWIDAREAGLTERGLAAAFLNSDEFASAFGPPDDLSDRALVEVLYRNVLEREGEEAGIAFWEAQLARPAVTRADLLLAFADSVENVAGSPEVTDLAELEPGEWGFFP